MSTCKACGNAFRKGVLAFLLTPGGLKGARVCQSCAAGGVLLVAPKLGPVVQKKTVRSDGVERALRQLKAYVNRENKYPHSEDRQWYDGRTAGFEGAIEVLKRECGE